jgi:HlyD family secretion protein
MSRAIAAAPAALTAVAAIVIGACGSAIDEPALAEVKRDELVVGVEVTGVLAAVDSTSIKPPPLPGVWNFKIASLAAEGQEVKSGDPVVGFDASDQIRELENMQNEAAAAQTRLAKKRDDAQLVRRDEELKLAEAEAALRKATLKTDAPPDLVAAVSQRELELEEQAARLALDAAKQHAEQTRRSDAEEIQRLTDKASYAQQRVAQLQQTVARMHVTATRAGTIVYPVNGRGDKHKLGDSVWRMEDVVQIVGLGRMLGNGQIDEVDVARVAEHQPVVLRLDALPDVELHGQVASIASGVQAKSSADPSKVVKLSIAIDPTRDPLRPGMRFRGEIEAERVPNAVVVPADAVFATPDGPIAYRRTAGGFERVRLELGRRTATRIEVKSGLAPGDRVSRRDPGVAP